MTEHEQLRNASLIAAAPDLLEAAKAALEAFDDSGGNLEFAMPVIKQIFAAIAKAEGQS